MLKNNYEVKISEIMIEKDHFNLHYVPAGMLVNNKSAELMANAFSYL
jgi:hypothetical protein